MTHETTAADRIEKLISDLTVLDLKRRCAIEDAELCGCDDDDCERCCKAYNDLFRYKGGIDEEDLRWTRGEAAWLKVHADDVPAEAVPTVNLDLFWGVDTKYSIEGKDAERAMMLLEEGLSDAWRATIARQTERRQAA